MNKTKRGRTYQERRGITMGKLGKIAVMGTILLLTGCSKEELRDVPIFIAQAETSIEEVSQNKEVRLDRTELWVTGYEQEDKEIAPEYLGDIELGEDWSPELPTKRREGVYKPSKLEDGVWHWELDENAPRGHHVPFNNKGNL